MLHHLQQPEIFKTSETNIVWARCCLVNFKFKSKFKKTYCILFKSYTLHTIRIRHITSIASNLSKVTLDNNLIITCKVSGFTCKNNHKEQEQRGRQTHTSLWAPRLINQWQVFFRTKGCRYGTEKQTNKNNVHDIVKFSDKVIIIHASVVIARSNMPWFYVWYSNDRLNMHQHVPCVSLH